MLRRSAVRLLLPAGLERSSSGLFSDTSLPPYAARLHQAVLEYDHRRPMRERADFTRVHRFRRGAAASESAATEADGLSVAQRLRSTRDTTVAFANQYFSGSLVACVLTLLGVALLLLTYVYNIGRPVLEAHEHWYRETYGGDADTDDDRDEGDADGAGIVPEDDDDGGESE